MLIGHRQRFNPFVVALKQQIPSLGRLIAINGLWTVYKPLSYFHQPTDLWRRFSSTGGPIRINLIHEIDLLHYWYGPITRVYAEPTLKQRGFDAEEGAAITLRFQSGMVGTFLLSDAVPSPHSYEAGTNEKANIPYTGKGFHRVFGENGSLSVPDMTRWDYGEEKKDWTREVKETRLEVHNKRVPLEEQLEHFVKVIRGEEQPRCDGVEALRAVVVCEAVKRSMREGMPVEITQDLRLLRTVRFELSVHTG